MFSFVALQNMATIGIRFGRAANHFICKTYRRYLPKGRNKRTNSEPSLPPVSTSVLLGEIPHVAVQAADEVSVGPVREGCVNVDLTTLLHLGEDTDECNRLGRTRIILRPDSIRKEARRFRSFATLDRSQLHVTLRSFWGYGPIKSVRAYSNNGATNEPLYKTKTGYYDVLEVASAATQAQIKTAYYKQSFIYHPDRNAGSEQATARFSEISEAYTVLGNKALRKKYDRGLLTQSDLLSTSRATGKETTGGSAKQSQVKRSMMSADGQGGVYNFDKFFKEHYQEQLQRGKDIRARKEQTLEKKNDTTNEMKLGLITEMGLGIVLVMTVAMLLFLKPK